MRIIVAVMLAAVLALVIKGSQALESEQARERESERSRGKVHLGNHTAIRVIRTIRPQDLQEFKTT